METSSSSLESIWEAAMLRSGVVGNPYLAGGYLIGSSLLGLLVIIGAFWYNRSNLSLFKRACAMSSSCQDYRIMSIQVIFNTLVSLLINDALKLIVAITFGATLVALSCDVIRCDIVEMTWFLSRWFAMNIHLVNASLCIYNLRQPLSVIRFRSIEILIGVLNGIIVPLYLYVTKAAIFTLAAFMFLLALSVIVTSAAPTSSPSTSTLKKLIMVVAMCNFLVVYVPTFILQCLVYTAANVTDLANYQDIYFNVLYFTNLHLIFDGLQCALFLKLHSGEEQQQQQPEELQQPQQQQQQLGFQNAGFTGSTNVYQ